MQLKGDACSREREHEHGLTGWLQGFHLNHPPEEAQGHTAIYLKRLKVTMLLLQQETSIHFEDERKGPIHIVHLQSHT